MKKLGKRSYFAVITFLGIVLLVYFVWPRFEYISVKEGVAIVDSFYSSTPQFTDKVVNYLESKGIEVDVYRDKDVNVTLFRRLPRYGYRLVVLRVHTGINLRKGDLGLFTNEPYSKWKYTHEQMTRQIRAGVIYLNDPNEKPVFTVSSFFISNSMEGRFNDTVIIHSSCYGLSKDHLAEAFISKGARALISWDEKVDLSHTDEASMVLLQTLLEEKMTIEEAVEKVMQEVGPDPIYNSNLKYYPQEANSLKLKP